MKGCGGEAAPLRDRHGVWFVPIRHHSPACAAHLQALLDAVRPRRVLIEAPVDYQPLLPLLNDPATRPPVAVVAFPARPGEGAFASYYPLCAHSPEFVALRWAAAREGTEVGFIDLPSDHRMMQQAAPDPAGPDQGAGPGRAHEEEEGGPPADRLPRPEGDAPALNLAAEPHFDGNDYIRALCRRTACRDQNELWDHLFEARLGETDWRRFFRDVEVYCRHVRWTCRAADLEADGTLAREAQMAAMVRSARTGPGETVVITGGLHTCALREGAAVHGAGGRGRPVTAGRGRSFLIRYGFSQLDRLSGYGAGLPLPGYYHRVWEVHRAGQGDAPLDLLSGFGAWLQGQGPGQRQRPSLPVLADAYRGSLQLAALRRHPRPLREDLLDACRSAFGQGTADNGPLLDHWYDYLRGSRMGEVPSGAGSPPLVEAVRSRGRRLRFRLEDGAPRHRDLDIYRKPRHREASRFLHAMTLLDTGFGERLSGPDFHVALYKDLLHERWRYAWSPLVEARLVELAGRAETLEQACLLVLREQMEALRDGGRGNRAPLAVDLYHRACQAGLDGGDTGELLALVEQWLALDPRLESVVEAARRLYLLWRGREVPDRADGSALQRVLGAACRRALYLLPGVAGIDEGRLSGVLDALANLYELAQLGADSEAGFQGQALADAVARLRAARPRASLAGAVAALGLLLGQVAEEELLAEWRGHLGGAVPDPAERVAWLRGLLRVHKALLWQVPALLEETDRLLGELDGAAFLELLPHLRLALAVLDPRDTDRLAARVAALHGLSEEAPWTSVSVPSTATEVAANLAWSESLRREIEEEGLGEWLTFLGDRGRD